MLTSDKLSNSFHAADTNGRLDLSSPGVHPAAQRNVRAMHDRGHGQHNSPRRVLILIGGAQLAGCLRGQASPPLGWDASIE